MESRIETLKAKKLVGKRLKMSVAHDKTTELWKSFMPERNNIKNRPGNDLICVQVYDPAINFKDFNEDTEFEKWAAAEVSEYDEIPAGMEPLAIPAGLYAVFLYKGAANDFGETFHFIFGKWLPASIYDLDTRPHFQILGEKYKNNDPASEEEVWIPLKLKETH